MIEFNVTEEKVKNFVDLIRKTNVLFDEHNINNMLTVYFKSYDAENNVIELTATVPESAMNRIDTAHGGYVSGLMDECMGIALHSYLYEHNMNATTSDMSFYCLKGLRLGDQLTVRVRICHIGKRTAVTTSEIIRAGEICAVSTENWAMINNDHARTLKRYEESLK